MTPKEFYSSYQADDQLSPLSAELIRQVMNENPGHVLDFGCGTGKHIAAIKPPTVTCGLDISLTNIIVASVRNECQFLIQGNEAHLGHLTYFDVIMTCSVLDHIEEIDGIIRQFRRIARKAIVIAETNDTPGEFYYPHDYEKWGFVKQSFTWQSPSDGATYNIWKWSVLPQYRDTTRDDLG